MRCSELRGLTWDYVDLEKGFLRVRQRADFQGLLGAPKSAAGIRDIPMAPMGVTTLREWKLACPRTPARLVFPTRNGRPHANANVHKQCWGPLQRAAGLVDMIETSDGKKIERVANGFPARVVQHEVDHLDGTLYPARMKDMSKLIFESEIPNMGDQA